MVWQLQEADNKLGQIIQAAQTSGPQAIAAHGEETAIVLSMDDYRRLLARRNSLVDFLQGSPWADTELELDRSPDLGRDIEL